MLVLDRTLLPLGSDGNNNDGVVIMMMMMVPPMTSVFGSERSLEGPYGKSLVPDYGTFRTRWDLSEVGHSERKVSGSFYLKGVSEP